MHVFLPVTGMTGFNSYGELSVPSKKCLIPLDPSLQPRPKDHLLAIRELATNAARALSQGSTADYAKCVTAANKALGKWERGYWTAWREAEQQRIEAGW